MTLTENRTLQIGIGGSIAVHVVLFLILAWMWGANAAARWLAQQQHPVPEKQVTLLFPDQVIEIKPPAPAPPPPPPPPEPAPKPYIRTTQNTAAANAPVKADFVSDRNTIAASKKAAFPDGDKPMPTQDGIDRTTLELANRNQRDGQTKDDSASAAPPAPPPQMRVPEPAAPQPAIAKAEPASPVAKMMEEMDKEAVKVETKPLPFEMKKPDAADKPPAPAEEKPAAAKAVPVDPTIVKAAPKSDSEAFTPFTRTSKVKGTINNRGEDAVNAAETPMGKYMRSVTASVEKKWHLYRRQNADVVTFGNLKLRFFVTKDGKPVDMEVLSKPEDADVRMADFTLRAIKDAEIPPIPKDLLPMLEDERVEIEYDVLIY